MKLVIVLVMTLIVQDTNLASACDSKKNPTYTFYVKNTGCDAYLVPMKGKNRDSKIYATYAHCLVDDNKVQLDVNDLDLTMEMANAGQNSGPGNTIICEMLPHPNYVPATRKHDVGLVKLPLDQGVKGTQRHGFRGEDAEWIKEWFDKDWQKSGGSVRQHPMC